MYTYIKNHRNNNNNNVYMNNNNNGSGSSGRAVSCRGRLGTLIYKNKMKSQNNNNNSNKKLKVLTLLVTSETSLMMASNAAVSSACFWLRSAIFSLNFRGFAMMAGPRHKYTTHTKLNHDYICAHTFTCTKHLIITW